MALTNLNNTHLDEDQVTAIQVALATLESSMADINVSLTAADRQRYGSINEQNKLFVNKIADYHNSQPGLQTSQVDWTEFDKDYASRAHMENFINRLEALITKLKNAKILHDYDNFQAALVDYAYTNFMAGTGANGYETKQNELKQFFTRTPGQTPPTDDEA